MNKKAKAEIEAVVAAKYGPGTKIRTTKFTDQKLENLSLVLGARTLDILTNLVMYKTQKRLNDFELKKPPARHNPQIYGSVNTARWYGRFDKPHTRDRKTEGTKNERWTRSISYSFINMQEESEYYIVTQTSHDTYPRNRYHALHGKIANLARVRYALEKGVVKPKAVAKSGPEKKHAGVKTYFSYSAELGGYVPSYRKRDKNFTAWDKIKVLKELDSHGTAHLDERVRNGVGNFKNYTGLSELDIEAPGDQIEPDDYLISIGKKKAKPTGTASLRNDPTRVTPKSKEGTIVFFKNGEKIFCKSRKYSGVGHQNYHDKIDKIIDNAFNIRYTKADVAKAMEKRNIKKKK